MNLKLRLAPVLLKELERKVAVVIVGIGIDPFHPKTHFDNYGDVEVPFGGFKAKIEDNPGETKTTNFSL